MFMDCWEKYDFLERELNTIEVALKQAETQQDEESCIRYKRLALMHIIQMQEALEYFKDDLAAAIEESGL